MSNSAGVSLQNYVISRRTWEKSMFNIRSKLVKIKNQTLMVSAISYAAIIKYLARFIYQN